MKQRSLDYRNRFVKEYSRFSMKQPRSIPGIAGIWFADKGIKR